MNAINWMSATEAASSSTIVIEKGSLISKQTLNAGCWKEASVSDTSMHMVAGYRTTTATS